MGTEEPKPAEIEETRTLATDDDGAAVETGQDGDAEDGDGKGDDEPKDGDEAE